MRLFILFFLTFFWAHGIQAHVNLTSPQGGETFTPGQTIKITWKETVSHDTENWDLYFSKDGGTTYEILQLDIDVKTLEFDWTIPTTITDKARIKVVQDNTEGDYSDESAFFTIQSTQTALGTDQIQKDFLVFPNPVNDVVHVQFTKNLKPEFAVSVFDPLGHLMYQYKSIQPTIDASFRIDSSKWPAGMYWMAIKSGKALETRKILKH